MTETGAPPALPVWRRLLARRRHRVLLVLVLALVALRVALPAIVRRVAVAQADQAMVGRVEIDDVDLALLTGGFTLHGLRVFGAEADPAAPVEPAVPRQAGEGPPGSAPVLSAHALTVDLGFLAFFRKTVEVQRIELAGVAVSLDRAADGTLLLPAAVPSDEPEPPPAKGPGWGVLIQSVALRDGRIGFRDFALGDPPQRIEVALPTLDAGKLALLITEGGVEPGKVSLDAGIQDGTLHLDATLESLPGGPAYESHAVLTNVPIADSRLYIPKVGWSGLTGHLDADLVHRFESQGAHTVRGTVGLRELDVRVDGLDDPALAWSALTVDVAGLDLVAQHADVKTVTLDRPRVVTRPAGPEPLPVLRGLFAAAAEQVAATLPSPSPAAASSPSPVAPPSPPPPPPASPTAASTGEATARAAPPPAGAAASPAADPQLTVDAGSKPWTWSVGTVAVNDGMVHSIGGDGPLAVEVNATVAPLTSTAGRAANLNLTLAPSGGGTVELTGDLTPTPLAFDGKLVTRDLQLPPLTHPRANATTRLLKKGVANLDLTIAAGATPRAPADGVLVSGTIALGDVEVAGEDPAVFGVRWGELAVGLAALTAPGVLAPGDQAALAPIDVAFTSIVLVRPDITVTRTAAGIALPGDPGAGSAPAAAATPAAAAAAPSESPVQPRPASPAVQVRVDRLALEKMRVVANDTTVKPFYRSTLDPIDFGATAVAWPGPSAKDVKLVAKGADGATLTITGNIAPARTRLVTKLAGLPLAPFNPYATSTGYGVGGGTAQLDSTITLDGEAYDTKSRIILNRLDVRGGEGDALFASKFGMPLSLALSLLTDLQGNIVLDLPIKGDATGMRTDLGTLVGNALARAILNAVTSPLKLIGAVGRIGDKPASLTPQPIVFLAGRATLAEGEEQKLAPLASLLAKAPGLRLHLRGEAGDGDRRWLREQALRAKLEAESGGFGAVRHVGERGVRKAVLAALTARAAGTPADVPAEHQAWFEAQVAAQAVEDPALQELAAARASAIRAKLASGEGVDAERVVLDEAVSIAPTARPVVVVGLGSPAPPSSTVIAPAP